MTTTEQNINLPDLKYGELIKELLHRPECSGYNTLRLIQGAIDSKRISSYIHKEEYSCVARDFGIKFTKSAAKALRKELIEEIAKTILEQKTDRNEEMLPDNYARLFHALTILKLEKDTKLFPGTTQNLMYNAMYMLWALDNSEEDADTIRLAGWYMSEEIKKRSGKPSKQVYAIRL